MLPDTVFEKIVLATHNAHKVSEFQKLVDESFPIEAGSVAPIVLSYDGPTPVEDGPNFTANALIKARAAVAHTGLPALADDSGIVVDLLGAAPGILSARWAGDGAGDAANRELLLAQISDLPDELRGARFHCTLALVIPAQGGMAVRELVADGFWPGRIAREPRGLNGFGYDPIFIPEGFDTSAAELSPEVKNVHSHRGRAFNALVAKIREL